MNRHIARNAALAIPLAALSIGRGAVASTPITPELIAPPAATQVVTAHELAQYRLPVIPLSASALTPAAEQGQPSALRNIASAAAKAVIFGALLFYDRDTDDDPQPPKRKP